MEFRKDQYYTRYITLHSYINDIGHVSDIIKPTLCFNTNKLSLNIQKTNVIIFTPNGKKYNISEAEINIDGRKMKHVKCTNKIRNNNR